MRRISFLLCFLTFGIFSCAGILGINLAKDPTIKSLKAYHEIGINKWKDTGIQVKEGEAIILTPLYPKGFLYPVKMNIKGTDQFFDGLDVDSEDIRQVKTAGQLRVGLDNPIEKPIEAGLFIFKNDDWDTILSDLQYIQSKNSDSKIVNLTLAILSKKKAENSAVLGRYEEALSAADRSIKSFQNTDAEMYSTSISRLYKLKAGIYKNLGDQERFSDNVNLSMEALMVASEYYGQLGNSRFSFLRFLTQEERLLLLTKTNFFQAVSRAANPAYWEYYPNLSTAYVYLSIYYRELGNLYLSYQYGQKAIEEAHRIGKKRSLMVAYYYMASRHNRFGFTELAEKSNLTALKYCMDQGDTKWVNYQMGNIQLRTGEITLKEYLRKMGDYTKDPKYEAYIRSTVGNYFLRQKEYTKAIPELERTLAISEMPKYVSVSDTWPLEYQALYSLCVAFFNVGRSNNALESLKKIEQMVDNEGYSSPLRIFWLNMLKSNFAQEIGIDPVDALKKAIFSLEDIRQTAGSETDYEFWESRLSVYNRMVDVLFQRSDFAQALEMAERAKSRRFLDYLGNKSLGVKSPSGSMLVQQADAIMDSLSTIEKDMVDAARAAGIKVRNVYQEGTRYSKQLESYRQKLNAVAKADKQFGIIKNITPVSPKEIQKKLGSDTTVIEYFLANNVLYSWAMDRENLKSVRQTVSPNEIRDLVVAFRENLPAGVLKRDLAVIKKESRKIADAPQKLYDLLISPVKKHIQGNRICIVPYGILNYLPFQALHDGSKYLVEEYAISYIPSLSVLEYLPRGERKENYRILAFGNPDLKDKAFDLPATEKEVDEIKSIFPGTEIYKREKATKVLAKKLASQFDIIHFASHGEYIQENPLASCIRLAPENEDDGRLEANEIFDMDMKADLVVTSACQTSIGQIRRGDEVVGLTRAFLYAGASSVLGSLWSISDEATAVFMKEFYANLKTFDKAEALRQAQVKMIQSKEYKNPFYWAAFNLTGSF